MATYPGDIARSIMTESYGITEDGRISWAGICEDGRIALDGSLIGDGRIIPIFMIFSEDAGVAMDSSVREMVFVYLLLKLLQDKKGININLSQRDKGLNINLSQKGKDVNLKLSQEGSPR